MIVGVGGWVGGGDVGVGGVGVGGGWVVIIFQGVLTKLKSFDEILTSEKNYIFCIFLLWGRIKLNFRDRYGKPNIYSKNSSCYQVFSSNSQKLSLWCKKKNHYPCRWICMTHIKAPTLFPRGIIIFQGVLTKFNFW